jgi:hypothetical protein
MTAPGNCFSRRPTRLICLLAAVVTLGWASSTAAATASDQARAAEPISSSRPADPGPGQTERIRFAPGTDHATVQGTFTAGSDDRYVLWARAGQSMTIAGALGGLGVGVFAPDGSQLPGGPGDSITYQLPATGDYTISIGQRRGEATTYAFTVTIPAPSGTTQRIRFAPGTDNATVHGTFREGQSDRYVLRAAAGQTMTVELRPTGTGAALGVFAPDGRELPSQPGVDFSAQLPTTGDYTIVVSGGRGDSSPTYALTVRIPAGPSAQRIQFAPGTNTASLHADVLPATSDRYVLRAAAGQTMVVHVAPLVHNITFSIVAPDGTVLAAGQERATVVLPVDGDYLVVVETTSSGGPYQITFWID